MGAQAKFVMYQRRKNGGQVARSWWRQKMRKYFKSSLVLELLWENKIEYEFIEENQDRNDDLNLLTLLRKFISKKLRK